MLNSGLERTLITERIVQLLKLHKLKCNVSLKGIDNSSVGSSNYKVNSWLQSPEDLEFKLPLNALVLKSLIQILILASYEVKLSWRAANDNVLLPDNMTEKIKSDELFDPENSVFTLDLCWNQTSVRNHTYLVIKSNKANDRL